eukprot:TRINITY_DN3352_c0_g1_i3.p2 TRINITY_DN3352_c0_g1~~TRINITY_DN3352_c0_g1_i3.p2  ORF type:complete len:236 (-),score=39.73 TRINITY_DN3352_c0_g1_i3:1171-1878(-)
MEDLESGVRVKFGLNRVGDFVMGELPDELLPLIQLNAELKELGATPVAADGKVAGNCGFSHQLLQNQNGKTDGAFFVSKSGKAPSDFLTGDDFVQILNFDTKNWSAEFKSCDIQTSPTSDLPLYSSIFDSFNVERFGWTSIPKIAIHGHSLATQEDAQKAGIPISTKITMFSTLEDKLELEELFEQYPYPKNKCYIRFGHGFFILGDSTGDIRNSFEKHIKPYLVKKMTEKQSKN